MPKLPRHSEEEILRMEDDLYKKLGAHCSQELAAWLSINHSWVLRMNNRLLDLEGE